jgi:hypothetical protein
MPQRAVVVHAMKATKRTGKVKVVSVSFTERSIPLVEPFLEKVRARLAKRVRQNGRFRVITRRGANDWAILFSQVFPERELDQMLVEIATELNALIFIEPGIPLSEMTFNPNNFDFVIELHKRRPNN